MYPIQNNYLPEYPVLGDGLYLCIPPTLSGFIDGGVRREYGWLDVGKTWPGL